MIKEKTFKYRKEYFIYIILLLVVVSIAVSSFALVSTSHVPSNYEPVQIVRINKDIDVTNCDTGETQTVNLPIKLPLGNYHYSFIATNNSEEKELYLYIRGAYVSFTISCENDVLYRYKPLDTNVVLSGGIFLRVIQIPRRYYGKEIRLSFSPSIHSTYGTRIPDVSIGTREDLLVNYPNKNTALLIINIFMLVFSVESFLLVLFLLIYKKSPMRTLIIPLFAFFNAGYLIIRTPSFYFLVGKGVALYIIEYLLLMILPICCSVFFVSIFRSQNRNCWQFRLYVFLSISMIMNMLVQIIMTFSGFSEFMAMQKTTHYLTFLFFVAMLLMPFSKKNERREMPLIVSTIALFLAFLITMVDYFLTAQFHYVGLITVAGTIFLLFQIRVALRFYTDQYNTIYMTKLYQKLAFRDSLTKLRNRKAFEREIHEIKKKPNRKFLFILIDLNNLKIINDTCGHKTGDDIIQVTGHILLQIQKNFPKTRAYRISGDKFIVMNLSPKPNDADDIKQYISNEVRKTRKSNASVPLNLGMVDLTVNISPDFNPDFLIQQANRKMYRNKKSKNR